MQAWRPLSQGAARLQRVCARAFGPPGLYSLCQPLSPAVSAAELASRGQKELRVRLGERRVWKSRATWEEPLLGPGAGGECEVSGALGCEKQSWPLWCAPVGVLAGPGRRQITGPSEPGVFQPPPKPVIVDKRGPQRRESRWGPGAWKRFLRFWVCALSNLRLLPKSEAGLILGSGTHRIRACVQNSWIWEAHELRFVFLAFPIQHFLRSY